MSPAVVAGGSSAGSTIIPAPARVIHYWTRSILRRLKTQEGGETVDATMKGTEEKEYSGDCHHKNADGNYGDGYHGINDDDSVGSSIEDDEDDGRYHDDIGDDGAGNGFRGLYSSSDDDIDRELCHGISYDGDGDNLRAAYSFSQYRVELFAVRTLVATNAHSYYWASQEEKDYHSVDLKKAAPSPTPSGLRFKTIEDDGTTDHDACHSFSTVDPYVCNNVMTRVISVTRNRKIELTFMALHSAIQANVHVSLDFASCDDATRTGAVYHVYGEITAHHQLYNGRSRRSVVPVYLEPVLMLKFDLHVPIHCDHDDGGRRTMAFRDNVTFYRDQFEEKIICSANHGECHHGKVRVRVTYQ
ncbi:hypothetical protein VPH35_139806 [Triticum aestivum]